MDSSKTIGDVLYAGSRVAVAERGWEGLIRCIAAGDEVALLAIYGWTNRLVFTLALRLLNDWSAAEKVTLDVFHDVWKQASRYKGASGSVVGWIMNLTHSRAMREMRFESQIKHSRHLEDIEKPPASLCDRLVWRIGIAGDQTSGLPISMLRTERQPAWSEIAPGISCDLLATDADRQTVSLLVRLAPGMDYPPHRHAGVEELHLLNGELMINDRKLFPGDYNRAEAGSVDTLVRSETGCTCVLITSTQDELH